jgi:hypothetical protein
LNACSGARGLRLDHARRPAGEDDRLWRKALQEVAIDFVERMDLAIDAILTHAPRDELRYLTAEIDDQDAFVVGGGVCGCSGPLLSLVLRHGLKWSASREASIRRNA